MKRHAPVPTLLALLLLLVSMGSLGCVDPQAGDTSTTVLYAYDDANKAVLVWNDVNNIYNLGAGAAAAAPDRTITGPLISSLITLSWGGMVMNPYTSELFLVDENGTVVRIEKAKSQNGSLNQPLDIASFTLGSLSDHLSQSVFSQAAIDTSTNTLYVAETGSNSQCRIWVVANPSSIPNTGQAPAGTYLETQSTDTGGTGVAAGSSGSAFGYFLGGQQVVDNNNISYTGARVRLATGGAFPFTGNVLIGSNTLLGDSTTTYGTLAYDTTLNRLYVARTFAGGYAVESFYLSQFTGGSVNQNPIANLADTSADLASLRLIAHGRSKDWLAGVDIGDTSTGDGTGTNVLHLWKGPSQGLASESFTFGAGVAVKGLALDGSQ